MPLISNGESVADPWVSLADEAPLPEAGDVILGLARLERDAAAVARRPGRTGVALANSENPRALLPFLQHLDLIALEFPAFTDGRAYSQARLLRAGLGFTGELRATGQVLADQAAFMQRCGFDSFEVDDRQSLAVWRRASRAITLAYQRGYREPGPATRGEAPRRVMTSSSPCVSSPRHPG